MFLAKLTFRLLQHKIKKEVLEIVFKSYFCGFLLGAAPESLFISGYISMYNKLVWTDITLSIFKETPVIPPLDYPYERPVKRKFQKSLVFLCL